MIPSINAMTRAARQLELCAKESEFASRTFKQVGMDAEAEEYSNQAYDYIQVGVFLAEQIELRQPKKKKKK